MRKITVAEALKKSILVLEQRQTDQGILLKEQLTVTYESLKPINFIRKVINEIKSPSVLKDNLIQTATGLISGYLTRKIVVRSSTNPFLRLAGILVQYGVTNFVSNHSASIIEVGQYYLKKLTADHHDQKG